MRNFEFKAKVEDTASLEEKLLTLQPDFRGTDHQMDTYFKVKHGRLKLREGNIENALIQYDRKNTSGVRLSEIQLFGYPPDPVLKAILSKHFEISIIVRKTRKIYYVNNVKFHFDNVERLGSFVEVEATDPDNQFSDEQLRGQIESYFNLFGLEKKMLIHLSYSDMILSLENG